MTDKEAMVKALEALEGVLDDAPKVLDASISGGLYEVVQCRDAITALKEHVAQPEQEPVAYLCENAVGHKYFRWKKPSGLYKPLPLYTHPPQRTEPLIGCVNHDCAKCKEKNT